MNAQKLRQSALWLSGPIGFIFPAMFAWDIYAKNFTQPQNVATWGMVLFMDVLGLILVLKAGNKRPILQIGWCAAAVCIMLAIIVNESRWHWGWVESISILLCGISVWLWQTRDDPKNALWFYMAAMYVSFAPQAYNYWYKPQPETLYLWTWSIVGCVLAIAGSKKRDFANTFVPWGAAILNVLITILVLL